MNKRMFIALTILFPLDLLGQDGYIYKQNALGTIEIYESSYGLPKGLPIGTIKKNAYGYIEIQSSGQVKNFNQTIDPYSHRPQLTPIKPYLASVSDIINTTNTYLQILNDQKSKQDETQSLNIKKSIDYLNTTFKPFQAKAKKLKSFLNSYANIPDTIKRGWHNVLILSKPVEDMDSIGMLGYAAVQGNKIQHLLQQNLDTKQFIIYSGNFITGNISKCQAFIKKDDLIMEVLFIDYAIDPQPLTSRPKFGGVTFVYPNQKMPIVIEIYDYVNSENKNSVGIVISETNEGGNYFTGSPGKYRYIVKNFSEFGDDKFFSQGSFELKDTDNKTIIIK